MKSIFVLFVLFSCIIGHLYGELDFCGRTILVVLEPRISHYTGTLDASFFGNFEKDSIENLT